MPNGRVVVKVRPASRIIQNSRWRIKTNRKTQKGLSPKITINDPHPRNIDAVESVQTRGVNGPEMKVARGITGVRTRSAIIREMMIDIVMTKKKGIESRSTGTGTVKESVTQGAKKKRASINTKANGADLLLL